MDVTDGQQLFLFDLGAPKRRRPTQEELDAAVQRGMRIAVNKHHRGRPPKDGDWEDLFQEVMVRALQRLRNFQHGGRKTLDEYAYMAAYFSLVDIQREDIGRIRVEQTYPLLESC